jgi:DNA-binding transcriptional ArsR family regulator
MADIFDVLADETRRNILVQLRARGETTVGDLVAALGTTQPTASKHLTVLRDAGLVTVREDGRHRLYTVRIEPLAEVDGWLSPFFSPATETPDGESPVFVAWAGTEVGDRVGRVAAETAHSARVAFEAAQEKIQGAQKAVADRLPRRSRD